MDLLDRQTSGTLAALALAGAAFGFAPPAQGIEPGYTNFTDFAARNNLKPDGSDHVFLNQTEKLAAIIKVVPDTANPMAGTLLTTIVHRGYAQIYDLEERIQIGADGRVQSGMTGSGRGMEGYLDRQWYDSLVGEFGASQQARGYDSPIGEVIRQKGYGIGGAVGREGDYHRNVDPDNRSYATGSCLTISDVRALCTTGFYLDQQSEYRFRIETFQQNAGQVTMGKTEIGRQYDSTSERNMVRDHRDDSSGVIHFSPGP